MKQWEKRFDEEIDNLMVFDVDTKKLKPMREKVKSFISSLLAEQREETVTELIELFTKKVKNDKDEPICPNCGKDMERDVQEPQGYLWFCPCTPALRLSIG